MSNTKIVKIRLYKKHDMDILTLYADKSFDFMRTLKHALHAYIGGERYLFSPPDLKDYSNYQFKPSYQLFLRLDKNKDADIINWLSGIKDLMRNAAIKAVFRGSMVGTYAYACVSAEKALDEANESKNNIMNIEELSPAKKKGDKKKTKKTVHKTKENVNSSVEKKIIMKDKKPPADKKETLLTKSVEPKEEKPIESNDDGGFFSTLGSMTRV